MGKSSPARIKANAKYNLKAYESIGIRVPKGIRDRWRTVAESRGLSLRAFIIEAVEAYTEAPSPAPSPASPLPSPEAETAGESGDDF